MSPSESGDEVRGRVAELAAALSPRDDHRRARPGACPSSTAALGDPPSASSSRIQVDETRRAVRRACTSSMTLDVEAELGARARAAARRCRRRCAPKRKSLPTSTSRACSASTRIVAHEVLGLCSEQAPRRSEHERRVDAGLGEQSSFCSLLTSACGQFSGARSASGWRSKVTTTERERCSAAACVQPADHARGARRARRRICRCVTAERAEVGGHAAERAEKIRIMRPAPRRRVGGAAGAATSMPRTAARAG